MGQFASESSDRSNSYAHLPVHACAPDIRCDSGFTSKCQLLQPFLQRYRVWYCDYNQYKRRSAGAVYDRMIQLCALAAVEEDSNKLLVLVEEARRRLEQYYDNLKRSRKTALLVAVIKRFVEIDGFTLSALCRSNYSRPSFP